MKDLNYSYRVVRVSKLFGSKSPVTDWFSEYSEANASCLVFNQRFEDYPFYFIVERKMVKS